MSKKFIFLLYFPIYIASTQFYIPLSPGPLLRHFLGHVNKDELSKTIEENTKYKGYFCHEGQIYAVEVTADAMCRLDFNINSIEDTYTKHLKDVWRSIDETFPGEIVLTDIKNEFKKYSRQYELCMENSSRELVQKEIDAVYLEEKLGEDFIGKIKEGLFEIIKSIISVTKRDEYITKRHQELCSNLGNFKEIAFSRTRSLFEILSRFLTEDEYKEIMFLNMYGSVYSQVQNLLGDHKFSRIIDSYIDDLDLETGTIIYCIGVLFFQGLCSSPYEIDVLDLLKSIQMGRVRHVTNGDILLRILDRVNHRLKSKGIDVSDRVFSLLSDSLKNTRDISIIKQSFTKAISLTMSN